MCLLLLICIEKVLCKTGYLWSCGLGIAVENKGGGGGGKPFHPWEKGGGGGEGGGGGGGGGGESYSHLGKSGITYVMGESSGIVISCYILH